MRRVRYSVAMSLDGFIAGPNGEHDWIIMDPSIDFAAFFKRFDTVLLGRKTYALAQGQGSGGGMPGMRAVVCSRTLPAGERRGATIVGDDALAHIAALRASDGKEIWLMGGGALAASLLDAKLIDTVEVSVIPVVLGSGIPLFASLARSVRLRLSNTKTYPSGIVMLSYDVDHSAPKTKKASKRTRSST